MRFETYGPFDFDVDENKRTFWKAVRTQGEQYEGKDLDCAIGCYLFALKNGEKYKPWYVGKTTGAIGFKQEVFADHKKSHYRECIKYNSGKPVLFLFPLVTEGGNVFSKSYKSSAHLIDWVEKMLIGVSLKRNINLINLKDTKYLRECYIEGVFGSQYPGKPSKPAMAARKALFG